MNDDLNLILPSAIILQCSCHDCPCMTQQSEVSLLKTQSLLLSTMGRRKNSYYYSSWLITMFTFKSLGKAQILRHCRNQNYLVKSEIRIFPIQEIKRYILILNKQRYPNSMGLAVVAFKQWNDSILNVISCVWNLMSIQGMRQSMTVFKKLMIYDGLLFIVLFSIVVPKHGKFLSYASKMI